MTTFFPNFFNTTGFNTPFINTWNTPFNWNSGFNTTGQFVPQFNAPVNTGWNTPFTGTNIPFGFNTGWNTPFSGTNVPFGFNTGWNTPFASQFAAPFNGFSPVNFSNGFNTPFNWNSGFNTPINSQFGGQFVSQFPGFSPVNFNTNNARTTSTNTNGQFSGSNFPTSYPFFAYAFNPYFGINTPVNGVDSNVQAA